jgi:hypothetical protein
MPELRYPRPSVTPGRPPAAEQGITCRESADLIYQLVVLWHECGITPDEVWAEMHRRADKLGIAEKLPKSTGRRAVSIGCGK